MFNLVLRFDLYTVRVLEWSHLLNHTNRYTKYAQEKNKSRPDKQIKLHLSRFLPSWIS